MIANRVQETTTSTGTGNLTLAGAVANHQTINTGIGTDVRFPYFVVDDTNSAWEHGVGYLSDATTLVRETVLRSSNTDAPINFLAGTKTVFIAPSVEHTPACYAQKTPNVATGNRLITSSYISNTGNATALTADRLMYIPYIHESGQMFDAFGLMQTVAQVGTVRIGLYDCNSSGDPGALIQEVSFSANSVGLVLGTYTARRFPPGKYWIALWSDTNPTFRSHIWYVSSDTGMCGQNYEGRPHSARYINAQSGLTGLPNPATAPDTALAANVPTPFMRPVT